MTAGFHSPLPPAPSGVGDYSAALLTELRRFGSVEVNAARAAVHLYHLGNNRLHGDIYRRALACPGVAVLHDAVLNHFFLGWLSRDAYIEEFVYNYGEWSRDLACELWRDRSRSGQDARYFQYGMLRRIAETSRAVVVHNPAAARIVAAHAPRARIIEIPHLFQPPELPPAWAPARFRHECGLASGTFLFGLFGHLREAKRVLPVLRAFHTLRGAGAGVSLLVAGPFASSDLERAAGPLLAAPGIVRIGYTPARRFWTLASGADACVNLRHPSAGETSGIAIRLMGIGKPVLVTAGEEVSRFPENACLRVDPGPDEEEMLRAYMLWLAQSPGAAREIGCKAARHIREQHAVAKAAAMYWEALEDAR